MNIEIIVPGTGGKWPELDLGLSLLRERGLQVQFDRSQMENDNPDWVFAASRESTRQFHLNRVLLDDSKEVVWAARGGYGCSDLLIDFPYESLNTKSVKLLVGFSDISALQSAVYAKMQWPSLHAPMLASRLWLEERGMSPLDRTIEIICGRVMESDIECLPIAGVPSGHVKGTLFGGCLSVLTNLIGTPYLPKTLQGHILFFEDIDENPGRIWRNIAQWSQSGLLNGVRGIVLGDFVSCFSTEEIWQTFLEKVRQISRVPVYTSKQFGHVADNWPMMIGAPAVIEGGYLKWSLDWRNS